MRRCCSALLHERPRLNREPDHRQALLALVKGDVRLMGMLAACRDHLPVPVYIGAGAVRNLVWDALHGFPPAPVGDVDVVFFDPAMAPEADLRLAATLKAVAPSVAWDVTNQAHVHLWYPAYFGKVVAPFGALDDALASWPDTATAVAVRLAPDGRIDIIAPFGLDDLFAQLVRWNPARASLADFHARIASKQWLQRWPQLRVLPDPVRLDSVQT